MKYILPLLLVFLTSSNALAESTIHWGVTAGTENVSCDVANCNVDISDFGASIGYQRSFNTFLLGGAVEFSNTGPGGSIFAGLEYGNSTFKVGMGKTSMDLTVTTQIALTSPGPTPFSNTVDEIVPDDRHADVEPEIAFLEYSYRLGEKPYSFSVRYAVFDESVDYNDTNIVTQDVGGGATFTRNVSVPSQADVDGSIITAGFNILF